MNLLYRKNHTPKEYKDTGRWLSYYNNPQFMGNPIPYKEGGHANPNISYEVEKIDYPFGMGMFLQGTGGGQDDDIRTGLPEKCYVIDASTVSDLGDGNSMAGAEKIEALVSNGEVFIPPEKVNKLGNGSNKAGAEFLDHLIKNVRLHKRGNTKLPPKAKSIKQYIGR